MDFFLNISLIIFKQETTSPKQANEHRQVKCENYSQRCHEVNNCSLSGHFLKTTNCIVKQVVYGKIDQTLVNSLHRLLYCEIGGLDCRVITTEYRTRVHCILICNALVHVIYSGACLVNICIQ